MENYWFNAFSCPGLYLKPQKCVFEIWWRHKPLFTIAWRHTVISFDRKCCFSSFSRKTIVHNCFHHFALSTLLWVQNKTSFWGSDDVTMMSQTPRPKLHLGTGSFLLSDTLGTIISSQTFLRKKRRKIWKSELFIIILPQHSILAVWQDSENTFVPRNAKYLAQWSILGYVLWVAYW